MEALYFFVLDGEDHWLSQATTRIQMLKSLEGFLAKHLGPGASSDYHWPVPVRESPAMAKGAVARRTLLAAAVATPAAAHGFHAAFTVIEHHPDRGVLDILHRIPIQDLEIILAARTGDRRKLDITAEMQNRVEDYLLDVFHLSDGDGRRLKPDWGTMKLEIDTAFVTRTAKVDGAPKSLVIDDQILTETNQDQVNTVNVSIGGRTRTAVFTINDPPQTLKF